jgi:hypothetical protein
MDEIPDDVIRAAGQIGEEIAEEVVRVARLHDRPLNPEVTNYQTVERIARRIDDFDPELASNETAQVLFLDLTSLFAPYVGRFLNLIRPPDGSMPERLPLLRRRDDRLIPIDTANERSAKAIVAWARAIRGDSEPDSDLDAATKGGLPAWDRLAKTLPFGDVRPVPEAARNFFSLFTVSYWLGRRSVAKTGQVTVHFTVDCSQHGYQLEYWPQFLFTPTAFGGSLTRPVSATVPINHYHFHGWLNNVLKPDGGLYPADANNTRARLRAF